MAASSFDQPFVQGRMMTAIGEIPVVGTGLTWADRLGGIRVRWGIGRNHYTVVPGLYALGRPDPNSPVLVTANYKLTFDALRRELTGLDAWLLVLDTNGINVWCAAGKKTFGTANLVQAVAAARLAEVVSHRRLILPQLGAAGVAAHLVKRASGFEVVYGPIRARDLPAFLAKGNQAEPETRRVSFALRERLTLIPMELLPALKIALPAALLLFGLSAWAGGAGLGLEAGLLWLAAAVAGSVLGPTLLPWLPGRAFALKGALLSLAVLALAWPLWGPGLAGPLGWSGPAAWASLFPAVVSFTLMNFTGATTFTSYSGVKAEMRLAVPLQIAAAAAGLALWFVALLTR